MQTTDMVRHTDEQRLQGWMMRLTAILLLVVFATGTTHAQFSFELNPTGDPIGGGPGYRDIKTAAQADYVVSTKGELLSALSLSVSGEIVYVDDAAEIDLTGEQDIIIPGGVTLASGRGRGTSRGALLYSNSLYPEGSFTPLFKTGGTGVRITGLRLRGPSADIADHDYELIGVALAVRALHESLEVDNSELWAWNKWAVWLFFSDGAYVHHNYIHHNRLNGYGYGVWCGGTTGETGAMAMIEANLFDFNRHSIASSGHPNGWEARYNIQLQHALRHDFDRHDRNSDNAGGSITHAHHNLFLKFGKGIFWDGVPTQEMRLYNNWFITPEAIAVDVPHGTPNVNYFNYDNEFSFDARPVLPTAQATASTNEGWAPLTVNFDATGSQDPEGRSLVRQHWKFNDGSDAIGSEAEGPTAQYTFTDPGLYNVELTVFNDRGLPGKTSVPIVVNPASGGYVLSAWLKDTYIGSLTGHYTKQILVDGALVWEDDVAGDEGWQHVLVDVTAQVTGQPKAEVAIRLASPAGVNDPGHQIIEIHLYVDDVSLSGGSITNGGFEEAGWSIREVGSWSKGLYNEEVRSLDWAYRLRKGYLQTTNAGDYVEIFTAAVLGASPPPAPSSGTALERSPEVPDVIALEQNYPNPFNPTTNVPFALSADGHVTLGVYDVLGREVATLVDAFLPTGTYTTDFQAGDLPSGVYLYKLHLGSTVLARRMLLLK